MPQTTVILILIAGAAAYYIFRQRSGGSAKKGNVLATFTRDLTEAAGKGTLQAVVGREREIMRVVEILSRKTKNNPLLLGEPGVGKTAIVEGLAVRMVRGEVPDELKGKRVLALDLAGLISGTKYRGEFENRVRGLVDEVTAASRQVILFIDEIHMLAQAKGAEGSLNVADILKPALARGELLVIGASTPEEYQQYLKPDETLDRRFQPILVPEPSEDEALDLLKAIRGIYEKFHGIKYADEALSAAVRLSKEFSPQRFLPDRAIDLIDEAGARVKIEASHDARHAVALAYFAGEAATQRAGAAHEHQMKIREEMEHLKTLEGMLPRETEVKDLEKKMEHLDQVLGRQADMKAPDVPIVTEADIQKIVTDSKK
jgi:ATP-dependent Clp protease ATP-binding subunit ClpC